MRLITLLFSLVCIGFSQRPGQLAFSLISATCGYALFWGAIGQDRPFFKGFVWFFTASLFHISWLLASSFQGIYILALYLLLAGLLGFQFGWLTFLVVRRKMNPLALAGLWVLCEWGRLFIFSGFPFHPVGMALACSPVSAQLARFGGVYALSFFVILFNIYAFYRRKKSWVRALALLSLFSLSLPFHEKEQMRVTILQPSHLPSAKREALVDEWIECIQEGAFSDLTILPETAFPYGLTGPICPLDWLIDELSGELGPQVTRSLPPQAFPYAVENQGILWATNAFFAQFASNWTGSEWILGLDCEKKGRFYNNAYHFVPYKKEMGVYTKQRLVPFAEYMPLSFFRSYAARYGIEGEFVSGSQSLITGERVPTAISICYEECFGDLIRSGKGQGAALLVNVTNDGWFAFGALPEVHLMHARLRAIENGIPLIHASNTGASAVIDAFGSYVKKPLPSYQSGVLRAQLPLDVRRSFYPYWGDRLIVGIALATLAFEALLAINRLFKKKTSVKVSS